MSWDSRVADFGLPIADLSCNPKSKIRYPKSSFQPVLTIPSVNKITKRFVLFEPDQWNRIVAMCSTRTAPEYPAGTHHKSPKRTMNPQCIEHVLRTGRHMPACAAKPAGKRKPVQMNRNRKDKREHLIEYPYHSSKIECVWLIFDKVLPLSC